MYLHVCILFPYTAAANHTSPIQTHRLLMHHIVVTSNLYYRLSLAPVVCLIELSVGRDVITMDVMFSRDAQQLHELCERGLKAASLSYTLTTVNSRPQKVLRSIQGMYV